MQVQAVRDESEEAYAVANRIAAQTSIGARRYGNFELKQAISGFPFAGGFGATLSKLLRGGIGVHHAGMLPRYRRLVEQLA